MKKKVVIIPIEAEWMIESLVAKCAFCGKSFPSQKKNGEIKITAWLRDHKLYCSLEHAKK
jgi:hypothetical protein